MKMMIDNDDVSRGNVEMSLMMVSNFRLTARTSTFQCKLITYLYRVLLKVGIDNMSSLTISFILKYFFDSVI